MSLLGEQITLRGVVVVFVAAFGITVFSPVRGARHDEVNYGDGDALCRGEPPTSLAGKCCLALLLERGETLAIVGSHPQAFLLQVLPRY